MKNSYNAVVGMITTLRKSVKNNFNNLTDEQKDELYSDVHDLSAKVYFWRDTGERKN
jgi:hypothetical protein